MKQKKNQESADKIMQLMSDYQYNIGKLAEYTKFSARQIRRMRSGMLNMSDEDYNHINLALSENAKRRHFLRGMKICKVMEN